MAGAGTNDRSGEPGMAPTPLAAENLYGDVLASLSEAILVADDDGRILYTNDAAARLSGRAPTELTDAILLDALSSDPTSPLRDCCLASLRDRQPIALGAYSDVLACWLELHVYPRPGGSTVI